MHPHSQVAKLESVDIFVYKKVAISKDIATENGVRNALSFF